MLNTCNNKMCFFLLSVSIYYNVDYYAYINAESVLKFFENVRCIDHVNGSTALVTETWLMAR